MSIQLNFFLNFFEARFVEDPHIPIIDGNNEPMCCEAKKHHHQSLHPNSENKF